MSHEKVHSPFFFTEATVTGDSFLDMLENWTPCDFFLWGFVKDSFYVPPLPMSLKELRDRITHALQTITADMLHPVWDEFDYHVDVCHVTQGAHIEGMW